MAAALDKRKALVLWFADVSSEDVALVGGKTSSLGEMYTRLTERGGTAAVFCEEVCLFLGSVQHRRADHFCDCVK